MRPVAWAYGFAQSTTAENVVPCERDQHRVFQVVVECVGVGDALDRDTGGSIERSIRPLALSRKNALFAGSDRGAEHSAVIASLIETCKLAGVEPQAYLTDVITRIVNGHPQSRLNELLPWSYVVTAPLRAVA